MSKTKKVQVSADNPVQLAKGTWIQADDRVDATRMLKSLDLVCAVWGFQNEWLRSALKYGHSYKTADEALEAARDALYEELRSHGIDIDKMIE